MALRRTLTKRLLRLVILLLPATAAWGLSPTLIAQQPAAVGLTSFPEDPFASQYVDGRSSFSATRIPNSAAAGSATPTAALIPAEPLAPGQGPSFDAVGPPSSEILPPRTRFPFWYASRFSGTWLSKGGSDGFGITDLEFSTSVAPIYFDDVPALMITPGLGLHLWNAPSDLALPAQVYDAYVDVNWRSPLTERLGLSLGVTPGLYGDFQELNSDAFQITGWGMGDFALSPRWTLVGGVAVVRQLESRVLPVGGLIWSPNEATRVELVVPRIRLARRVRSSAGGDLWAYAAGQFGGGSWAITLDDGTTTLLTYNDLRVVLGAEWVATNRLSGVAEIGYVFSRDIAAFDTSQFTPTDAFLLRVGATF